jgi:hypothetical protein
MFSVRSNQVEGAGGPAATECGDRNRLPSALAGRAAPASMNGSIDYRNARLRQAAVQSITRQIGVGTDA